MKQFIRKISAVGTSVAMLGMTVGGAVAADLADMPAPFVADGAYVSTAMVLGSTADTAARSTLKTYFDGFLSESTGGEITYNSDTDSDDDILLNGSDNLAGFGEVDSGLVDSLFEGEVEVNDTDYTAREIFNFSTASNVTTSYKGGQKEFGPDPYLAYQANSIKYGYSFTDVVPSYQVSADDTMTISFLGKDIEVKTISTTAHSVTLDITDTVSLDHGESTTYKGHTVKLVRVYTSSAAVDVDGEEHIISTGSTKDFGDDIKVKVDTVGEADDPTLSSAVLKLSEQGVSSTVSDGNAFELFEDYDTNSHSPWVWDISTDKDSGANSYGNLSYIGIDNRWTSDDLEPSQDYKTLPLKVGDNMMYPNNYASLMFDSIESTDSASFSIAFEDSKDLSDNADSTISVDNRAMAIIDSPDGSYFELAGTDYDTVYIVNNATSYLGGDNNTAEPVYQFWGEDGDGYHYTTGTSFKLTYNGDDNDISITWGNSTTAQFDNLTSSVNITANDWKISIPWNFSNDYIGPQESTDEASDIVIDDTNYGTREYDILLVDGTVVKDPDATVGADKFEFTIPNSDSEAKFVLATVTGVGDPVTADLLTADEDTSGYSNLVLVGGPAVNSVTASFMGLAFPSYGDASGITADTALVELVEQGGQTALIVAGWEAADTQRGASAVAAGGLSGASHIVT